MSAICLCLLYSRGIVFIFCNFFRWPDFYGLIAFSSHPSRDINHSFKVIMLLCTFICEVNIRSLSIATQTPLCTFDSCLILVCGSIHLFDVKILNIKRF